MKKFCFLLLMVLTSTLVFTHTARAAESLDKVVAVVNTDVITQSELNKAVYAAEKQLEQSNTPLPNKEALRKQVLNQLIVDWNYKQPAAWELKCLMSKSMMPSTRLLRKII